MLFVLVSDGVWVCVMEFLFLLLIFFNYYILVIGCYLDRYGIVDNVMFDLILGSFILGNCQVVGDGCWWNEVELIWVIVEKQGLYIVIMFWFGFEVVIYGVCFEYWFFYDGDMLYDVCVDKLFVWLDLFVDK